MRRALHLPTLNVELPKAVATDDSSTICGDESLTSDGAGPWNRTGPHDDDSFRQATTDGQLSSAAVSGPKQRPPRLDLTAVKAGSKGPRDDDSFSPATTDGQLSSATVSGPKQRPPRLDLTAVKAGGKGLSPGLGSRPAAASAFGAAYELGEVLGRGTTATVRLCTRRCDGCKFAVKCLSGQDDEQASFSREEYNLLRSLRHPAIVDAKAMYEEGPNIWLCLEFCAGGSVEARVRQEGPFAEGQAQALFKQLLTGVNYLHLKRIVHRDIKPANLLLDERASALKITDFNSATQIGNVRDAGPMLSERGTRSYLAPELCFGRIWNERVDIWACGLTLFFMLRGCLPFNLMQQDARQALFDGRLPPICWGSLSELTVDLAQQCLAADMHDRPAAMVLLLHPVLAGVGGTGAAAQPAGEAAEARPRPRGPDCDIYTMNEQCGLITRDLARRQEGKEPLRIRGKPSKAALPTTRVQDILPPSVLLMLEPLWDCDGPSPLSSGLPVTAPNSEIKKAPPLTCPHNSSAGLRMLKQLVQQRCTEMLEHQQPRAFCAQAWA